MAIKKETVPPTPADIGDSIKADFSYNELLNELVNQSMPTLNKEHEVSTEMYSLASGRTESACRDELDRKVRNGILKKHRVYSLEGRRGINAYYDPKKWNPS